MCGLIYRFTARFFSENLFTGNSIIMGMENRQEGK